MKVCWLFLYWKTQKVARLKLPRQILTLLKRLDMANSFFKKEPLLKDTNFFPFFLFSFHSLCSFRHPKTRLNKKIIMSSSLNVYTPHMKVISGMKECQPLSRSLQVAHSSCSSSPPSSVVNLWHHRWRRLQIRTLRPPHHPTLLPC